MDIKPKTLVQCVSYVHNEIRDTVLCATVEYIEPFCIKVVLTDPRGRKCEFKVSLMEIDPLNSVEGNMRDAMRVLL